MTAAYVTYSRPNQPANAIIVFAKNGELQFALREMKTLPPGLPLVVDMARLLLAKAHDEAEERATKIGLRANIPDGVYHLNLADEPAPLLTSANVSPDDAANGYPLCDHFSHD